MSTKLNLEFKSVETFENPDRTVCSCRIRSDTTENGKAEDFKTVSHLKEP